jgi:phthiocerol/phenolphthiocerol synthesis type-I polyketide synthase E
LADGGAGAPVFLVADGFGTTIGYQGLARLLGRPVFGLEFSAGVNRIEEMAEPLAAMLRPWSDTPIVLGGWSFGAVVAHDIARRIPDANIMRLLLLDGYAPYTGGRPIAVHRRSLTSVVRLHYDAALRRGPIGQRLARVPSARPLFLGNLRAMLRYRPGPVRPPASLLKVGGDDARLAQLERLLVPLYPGGVRVHAVPGDHWSMLQPPHVTTLAQLIQSELASQQVRA